MKYSCELVKDLIPLYKDEVCSDESKIIVEEHLKECEKCQKYARTFELDLKIEDTENKLDYTSVKKCFGKIRKRFAVILVAVIIALPVSTVILRLGINEVKKEGICFSNLDDYEKASKLMKEIKNGDYEKAFLKLDVSDDYESIITAKDIDETDPETPKEEIERKEFVYNTYQKELDMTLDEYSAYISKENAKKFEEAEEKGLYIISYKNIDSHYSVESGWYFTYLITYHTETGDIKECNWSVVIKGDEIHLQFYYEQDEMDELEDSLRCS